MKVVVSAAFVVFNLLYVSGYSNHDLNKTNFNREFDKSAPKSPPSNDVFTYIRASMPIRIFQCIRKLDFLRCIKVFLLQRMENCANFPNTGNITKDFMEQFVVNDKKYPSLIDEKYMKLSDTELTNRLLRNFKYFFRNRDIKLHFVPGVMVQVIPNTENKIKISFKKNENDENTVRKHRPQKGSSSSSSSSSYKHVMQIAIPAMFMPAVLVGSFLPYILPVLKMATIMSVMLNNGALLAALLYAARTAAENNQGEIINYSYPGYH